MQTRLARCATGNFTVNTWAVNSTPGGTGTYGTVVGNATGAIYTAPSQVPALNPVAVSVNVDAGLRAGGRATLQLVSNVLVYNDSWSGSAHSTTGTQTNSSTIKWVLQSRINNVATYRPTGTVTVSRPPCTVTPKDYTLQQNDGILVIDFTTPVATFYGYGFADWAIKMSCPQIPNDIPSAAGAAYFGGNAPYQGSPGWASGTVQVQNGIAIISGNATVGGANFTWAFTRDQ